MTPRRIGIIWGVAVVLVGIAVAASRSGDASATINAPVLTDAPTTASVKAIELDRGDDTWRFERDEDGRWWQVEPFRHRMDTAALMTMVETAAALRAVRQVDIDAQRAATLGVTHPSEGGASLARLVFDINDGEPMVLLLGRRGIGGRGWIRIDDAPTAMAVDASLHAITLDEAPQTWRDARLFPDVTTTTASISRTLGDEVVTLEQADGRWRFTTPITTRADTSAVQNHLGALASATFSAVLLDAPVDVGAFGLDPPFASIKLDTGGSVLHIGDRVSGSTGDRYAMVDGVPSVVRMPAATVEAVLVDPVTIVDRTGSGVAAADVQSIRVLLGDGELRLERSLDRWRLVDGDMVRAGRAEALLDALLNEPAPDVELVSSYPEALVVGTVVLEGAGRRPLDTVKVLQEPPPPHGQGRWGLDNGDGVLRILPAGTSVPVSRSALGV